MAVTIERTRATLQERHDWVKAVASQIDAHGGQGARVTARSQAVGWFSSVFVVDAVVIGGMDVV